MSRQQQQQQQNICNIKLNKKERKDLLPSWLGVSRLCPARQGQGGEMAYLLPPELVWGCLPRPLLLSRGLGMEETSPPGLVTRSTSSLAPDYSFQTQFVALPRAAASPEHVTRLFPPPPPTRPGPWGALTAAGSLLGPTAAQEPARSPLGLHLCSVRPAQPGPSSWITRLPLASVFRPWRDSFLQ